MTVSDQTTNEINQKVDRVAMAGVLDLRDIFELVNDGFDDGAFAK